MTKGSPLVTTDTFRFFRDLKKNNSKVWMDANRDRYRQYVVEPLHTLLDALAPGMQRLHPAFAISGRRGENFSRINRDIRFAKDKTPYYTHMYLFFSSAERPGRTGGQLYVGISAAGATVGFRIYHEGRESTMASICRPRAVANSRWLADQKKKLSGKFESYWYTAEKGNWTKHSGWPVDAHDWKRARGWIVRQTFGTRIALGPSFRREADRTFHKLFPIYSFCSLQEWKSRGRTSTCE